MNCLLLDHNKIRCNSRMWINYIIHHNYFSGQSILSERSTALICIIHKYCVLLLWGLLIEIILLFLWSKVVSAVHRRLSFLFLVVLFLGFKQGVSGPQLKTHDLKCAGLREPTRDSKTPRTINSGDQLSIAAPWPKKSREARSSLPVEY